MKLPFLPLYHPLTMGKWSAPLGAAICPDPLAKWLGSTSGRQNGRDVLPTATNRLQARGTWARGH